MTDEVFPPSDCPESPMDRGKVETVGIEPTEDSRRLDPVGVSAAAEADQHWIAEAPPGIPSSGPAVIWSEESLAEWKKTGWSISGPFVHLAVAGSQPATATAKVIVGESVVESATLTTRDGTLYVEFDAEDLDGLAIPLGAVAGSPADESLAVKCAEARGYARGRFDREYAPAADENPLGPNDNPYPQGNERAAWRYGFAAGRAASPADERLREEAQAWLDEHCAMGGGPQAWASRIMLDLLAAGVSAEAAPDEEICGLCDGPGCSACLPVDTPPPNPHMTDEECAQAESEEAAAWFASGFAAGLAARDTPDGERC